MKKNISVFWQNHVNDLFDKAIQATSDDPITGKPLSQQDFCKLFNEYCKRKYDELGVPDSDSPPSLSPSKVSKYRNSGQIMSAEEYYFLNLMIKENRNVRRSDMLEDYNALLSRFQQINDSLQSYCTDLSIDDTGFSKKSTMSEKLSATKNEFNLLRKELLETEIRLIDGSMVVKSMNDIINSVNQLRKIVFVSRNQDEKNDITEYLNGIELTAILIFFELSPLKYSGYFDHLFQCIHSIPDRALYLEDLVKVKKIVENTSLESLLTIIRFKFAYCNTTDTEKEGLFSDLPYDREQVLQMKLPDKIF